MQVFKRGQQHALKALPKHDSLNSLRERPHINIRTPAKSDQGKDVLCF